MASILLACLVTLLSYIQIRVAINAMGSAAVRVMYKVSQSRMCFVAKKTDSLWQRKCSEIMVALEEHSEEDGRNVSREAQDVQNVKKNENKYIR